MRFSMLKRMCGMKLLSRNSFRKNIFDGRGTSVCTLNIDSCQTTNISMRVLQIVAFKEAFTDRMQLQSLTNNFEEENNFVPLASSNVTSQCPRATLSFESASISWNSKTSGEAQFDDACDSR
jgi:hypothetical protein